MNRNGSSRLSRLPNKIQLMFDEFRRAIATRSRPGPAWLDLGRDRFVTFVFPPRWVRSGGVWS
jgi:hypothetical protein